MSKDSVLRLLREAPDRFVSGEEIAAQLGISRAAVCKSVSQLRKEGYEIRSVNNRGYALSSLSNVLSEEGVLRHLRHPGLSVKVYDSVPSTNTLLKRLASEGAPEGTVVIAANQTAGKGRLGRSFYSPLNTGIYFSLLLRPLIPASEALNLTAGAAVAVATAVEEISGRKTEIKWVNDVLISGKKICGILTEASINCETGTMDYAVVGIGINTRTPPGGFPEEIRAVAGSVFEEEDVPDLHCRLAAAVVDRFFDFYEDPSSDAVYQEYLRRSSVLGKKVNLIPYGGDPEPAEVLDIDREYALLVKTDNGELRRINSGEVSLRLRDSRF